MTPTCGDDRAPNRRHGGSRLQGRHRKLAVILHTIRRGGTISSVITALPLPRKRRRERAGKAARCTRRYAWSSELPRTRIAFAHDNTPTYGAERMQRRPSEIKRQRLTRGRAADARARTQPEKARVRGSPN